MIHIIDDWYMIADRYCYTVGRLRTTNRKKKDGTTTEEEYLDNATYHSTVGHALRSILQEAVQDKVAKNKITDLATLLETMEQYNLKLIKEFDKAETLLHSNRNGVRSPANRCTRTK